MMTSILLFFLSPLLKWVTITGVIGAAGIALFLFTPSWFPGQFRTIAGMIGVGALCGGIFYWYAFHAGERHMAQRIAAKDAAAVALVEEDEKVIKSCGIDGADWDVVTASCRPGSFQ